VPDSDPDLKLIISEYALEGQNAIPECWQDEGPDGEFFFRSETLESSTRSCGAVSADRKPGRLTRRMPAAFQEGWACGLISLVWAYSVVLLTPSLRAMCEIGCQASRSRASAIRSSVMAAGKSNHQFAHAVDGEIITRVITSVPPNRGGTQPDRLRPLAEELGMQREDGSADLDSDLGDMEILLIIAEPPSGSPSTRRTPTVPCSSPSTSPPTLLSVRAAPRPVRWTRNWFDRMCGS
jgi:hypothetical protein